MGPMGHSGYSRYRIDNNPDCEECYNLGLYN